MSVIENFAELSAQEQQKFADALIKTINSEKTFISEVDFKITEVGADELSGDLFISVSLTDTIEVPREARWQASDEETAKDDPGRDADYAESIYDDVKKAFKALSTVIDDYEVRVEIDDVDEEDTLEVEVDNYTHEDSGIGRYEYGDEIGYDSHPYVEVEGTITKECSCYLTFCVSPAENDIKLPEEVTVKKIELPDWDETDEFVQEEVLSDWLSDTIGFLHDGFSYEVAGDSIKISNIAWVID